MRLENKNIFVTAAAQGIGRATAIAFAKKAIVPVCPAVADSGE